MSWRDEALCVGKPPQWWLGETDEVRRLGVKVCDDCPVRTQCLVEQIHVEDRLGVMHGVYGGVTEKERRRIVGRRMRRIA